jgi:hypothetical protein
LFCAMAGIGITVPTPTAPAPSMAWRLPIELRAAVVMFVACPNVI